MFNSDSYTSQRMVNDCSCSTCISCLILGIEVNLAVTLIALCFVISRNDGQKVHLLHLVNGILPFYSACNSVNIFKENGLVKLGTFC